MAELTIQDVADYLANNGYTTWADLTRQKTLTETGLWSVLQHNYDSNHAINMGYVDLSDYLSETAMKQWVQGRGYVTESSIKSWVREQGYITSVPGTDLTGYATQQWVLERRFLTSHQSLADYATKQYADSKIIGLASQSWVSQNYATQAALSNYLPLSGGTLTGALTFANNTWNTVGDDCYIGDHNVAGGLGILGRNGNTRLDFCQYEHAETYQSIVFDGTNLGVQRWKIGECVITYDSTNGMLHFSHGIYSDGAVTAGGVGSSGGSGGGGGGGLSWSNLAAATTEQIALSHLTTALSGYLTSYGNRPQIAYLDNTAVAAGGILKLPLTSPILGEFRLDYDTICSGYAKTSDLSSYVTTGTVQTISEKKTFSKGIVANGVAHPTYNSSDYLLHGGGGVIHISSLRDNMSAATTNGNNTFTGSNTFTNSIELNDDAGIDFFDGTDTWDFFIDFSHDSRGSFCWCTAGQDIAWLDCDGVFHASGYRNSSDLRRKNLFGDVALSVADIAAMPAVRFRWNSGRDTQAMHVGTIAQAWQTLLPEVVTQGSDGLLSMDYASAALVSVINVAKSVSDHERRILDLEAENRRLKTELEQLKSA